MALQEQVSAWLPIIERLGLPVALIIFFVWFFLTRVWPEKEADRKVFRDELTSERRTFQEELGAERKARDSLSTQYVAELNTRNQQFKELTDIQAERTRHFDRTVQNLSELTNAVRDLRDEIREHRRS